jgi:glycosyltransferase involved in cell wall biosynthesis
LLGVTSSRSLQFVRPLARHLTGRGWQVDVVASFDFHEAPCENSPWNEHHLPMTREPSPLNDLRSLAKWVSKVWQLRPTVVVAGTPKAALLLLVVSNLLRIKHRVLLLHGLRLETSSGWRRALLVQLERMTAASATRIIAVSRSLAQKYTDSGFAPLDKVTVLGDGSAVGIDPSIFEPFQDDKNRETVRFQNLNALGLDPRKITFGYIGRMTHDKGIFQLIWALKLMAEKGREPQSLFVGSEEDSKILDDLALLANARAIPWTPEIVPIYCCIDVLCLPSLREGMPTVVLEAAMMGIPTIGTRSTGIVDAVQDGITGLLVDQEDPAKLADRMTLLVNKARLRKALGQNANRYVRTHFTQTDVLRRYGNFLEQLVTAAELGSSSAKKE